MGIPFPPSINYEFSRKNVLNVLRMTEPILEFKKYKSLNDDFNYREIPEISLIFFY